VYNSIKWTVIKGPLTQSYTTTSAHQAIAEYLEEDIEPFDEWVSQVRVAARKPKNASIREFLDRRYNAGRFRR
jgi:hypothetical protein